MLQINDLIFFLSFFGCDFIPRVPSFELSIHLDLIIECYIKSILHTKKYMVNVKNLNIDNNVFLEFLKLLKNLENRCLIDSYFMSNVRDFYNHHDVP